MNGIDIFDWVVLLVLIATGVVVFVVLGMLPGKIARQRQHPQAKAIQITSWLALFFCFVTWPFVLVWAYRRPVVRPLDKSSDEATRQHLTELQAHIDAAVEEDQQS